MTNNSIPASAKLPPKSLSEDTQDDEMPKTNLDEQHAPPVNMGNTREGGDAITQPDPRTSRVDPKDRIPAPQTANRT